MVYVYTTWMCHDALILFLTLLKTSIDYMKALSKRSTSIGLATKKIILLPSYIISAHISANFFGLSQCIFRQKNNKRMLNLG